jgi:hypothetical protein
MEPKMTQISVIWKGKLLNIDVEGRIIIKWIVRKQYVQRIYLASVKNQWWALERSVKSILSP